MILWLDYCVPVGGHPVVIVLRSIQLVVGERQLVLCASNGICVCLVPKMNVRYVEVVNHPGSFQIFTIIICQKMRDLQSRI